MTEEQKIKRAKELYGNLVYPKTHIELFVDGYLAGAKELEQENRLLGERCNQLLKYKGDLTDKIADIKANCDLAIEGRDIKIKELEEENNKLLDVINNQDVKIADLEKQIEGKENEFKYFSNSFKKKIKELKKRLVFARAEFQRQYKENEELKSELTKKADTNHSLVEQMANLESTFRICEQNADTYYDQRTKAKDLIENIIRVTWGEGWNYSLDWKVKAEQFIMEIKK